MPSPIEQVLSEAADHLEFLLAEFPAACVQANELIEQGQAPHITRLSLRGVRGAEAVICIRKSEV